MRRVTIRDLKRFTAYFLAWTIVGLFNFSRDITRRILWHDPSPWQDLLLSWMAGTYICATFTPAILWLGNKWPIERQIWRRRVALHLIFSICFSFIELAAETVVFLLLGIASSLLKESFWGSFSILLVVGFHGNIILYWLILGLQSGFRYYKRYQERELHASELSAQLIQAQLNALKMQLQPHFLFNTLNAIMVLVRQQKGRQAEGMLARLSDLLRAVLEDVDTQEVTLRRELEYLQLYLSIEEIRFQDRLRVDIFAHPETLEAAVPHMILQPVVENAVRHGIERRSAAGKIEVNARLVNESLEINVVDDGPGLQAENSADSRGIGLANTRARLKQLYGDAAKLSLENGVGGGTVATMVIPFRLEGETSEVRQRELYEADSIDR